MPSVLVFGEYPSLRAFGEQAHHMTTLAARAIIAKEARQEIDRNMARLRFNRALMHNVPHAADTVFEIGQKVLVWREKVIAIRIGEWLGPFAVTSVDRDKKIVLVSDELAQKPPKSFGFTQLKPYISPPNSSRAFFTDPLHAMEKFRPHEWFQKKGDKKPSKKENFLDNFKGRRAPGREHPTRPFRAGTQMKRGRNSQVEGSLRDRRSPGQVQEHDGACHANAATRIHPPCSHTKFECVEL